MSRFHWLPLAALVLVSGCQAGQPPANLAPTDVLGLNAQESDGEQWSRHRNEQGAWIQPSTEEGPNICFDEVLADCRDYLVRTGRGGQYDCLVCTHHARLWVLRMQVVHPPETIVFGGCLDLWYDVQQRRVVAVTTYE
jgi:hypothetical protein